MHALALFQLVQLAGMITSKLKCDHKFMIIDTTYVRIILTHFVESEIAKGVWKGCSFCVWYGFRKQHQFLVMNGIQSGISQRLLHFCTENGKPIPISHEICHVPL